MKRAATAVLLIPVVSYLILYAAEPWFLAMLAAIAGCSAYEFNGLVERHGLPSPGWLVFPMGLVLLVGPGSTEQFIALLALAALWLGTTERELKHALPRAGAMVLCVVYIFGCWRAGVLLRRIDPWWLFFACALNWVGDTAAMYVGKAIGKHKMAPRLSPGKSWEGAAASVVASVILGATLLPRVLPGVNPWTAAGIAALANAAGQIGDLAESALKRGAGVKDSGTMLPGHGGWLDRTDSSLFAIPVTYLLVKVLG